MNKNEFIEYVGGCFLGGVAVAVYRGSEYTRTLQRETAAGEVIGPRLTITSRVYELLLHAWRDGTLSPQDVTIVARALDFMHGLLQLEDDDA